ncbi:hypothetical protein E0J20_09380 [Rhizobium leguminosarum bv. viciae]|nr:hypothetical protein E0J20_09380 [Rhizobium leguminosarum bv. viciae]
MTDVIAAMNQMRAWLADGTISLEEVMHVANEALDEIEHSNRPTDPTFWIDAFYFVQRMNEKTTKLNLGNVDAGISKFETAQAMSGFSEFPAVVSKALSGVLAAELTAEQLGLVLRGMMTAYHHGKSTLHDQPQDDDPNEYGPSSIKCWKAWNRPARVRRRISAGLRKNMTSSPVRWDMRRMRTLVAAS